MQGVMMGVEIQSVQYAIHGYSRIVRCPYNKAEKLMILPLDTHTTLL